jgi:hypothetical protein
MVPGGGEGGGGSGPQGPHGALGKVLESKWPRKGSGNATEGAVCLRKKKKNKSKDHLKKLSPLGTHRGP